MIKGIGTDIVEVKRIQTAMEKYGDRFKNRLFTPTEQRYCDSFKIKKYVHYAARFAAKESFSKAIGTGMTRGFNFQVIGVENMKSGEPYLVLEGTMKERYGHFKWKVSLSHTDEYAIAYIVMEED